MRLQLVLITALLALLPPLGASAQVDPGLIPALRAGGTVIVLRHGATNPDQADTNPLDPSDHAKQRHLNDNGRAGLTCHLPSSAAADLGVAPAPRSLRGEADAS